MQKLLDVVERVGNKVPHPAILFFILIGLVILLSVPLAGISVSHERLDPETHKTEEVVTSIRSLLAGDGRPYLFTSYNASSGGSIINQVQDAFNGLGQLTEEWQAHSGAVNTNSTPNVQYSYNPIS
jgi:hypothetical protein